MLNPEGKIVGEFSVSRIGDEEFFLFGSQAAEIHHPRWFLAHLPKNSQIRFETLALSMVGLTVPVRDRVMSCKSSPALR